MNIPRLVSLRRLAMLGALACTVSSIHAQNAPANPTVPPTTPAVTPAVTPAAAPAQAMGRGRVQAGPPAPVPPEIAIPRPTAAELAEANDAVKKFVASDTSGIKPLLDKYPGLIVVQPPRANSAIAPYPRNATRHAAFVELAKQGNIDLLLDGDSITDWWTRNGNVAFAKYFGNLKTANFAVAGERTEQILWGLQNGEGQGFQPKAIMLMIGTNNANNTAPEVAEGIGAIVLEMRKDFPNAKILLLGIFPRGDPGDPVRAKIAEVNKIVAKLDDQQHVFYLDIGSKFLDENGVFLPGAFLPDKLHPQEKGYEIWGEAVQQPLANMMK